MNKWVIRNKKGDFEKMANILGINKVLAKILINKEINTKKLVTNFLSPSLNNFNDFLLAKDVKNSFNILQECINLGKKICIYGDYDVDGVTSTTILYKGLKQLTNNLIYYIPDREKEGYGLNFKAIKKLKELDVDLILTCDNGISSFDEVNYINELNMDVIIIDHHEVPLKKPKAVAIVNPKQKECNYPFKLMCAGGLSYRFIIEFFKFLNKDIENAKELLVFSMIATFCDIVDLENDNRIIAKNGLEILNKDKNINLGLSILINKKSIYNKKLNEYSIGFIIGPCINAVGRLEKATIAVDLFTSDDREVCEKLASELVQLNEKRKNLTKSSYENILLNIKKDNLHTNKVIVAYDENVHESIAGIVAGRIKDYFYKPCIVITKGEESLKGSARSIPSCDIFDLLNQNKQLFLKFGGHSMAAGLSITEENFLKLSSKVNESCTLKEDDFIKIIRIEEVLELNNVTFKLLNYINELKPYGKGNEEPLFGTKNVKVIELKVIEEKDTLIFTFEIENTYRKIKGICFGSCEKFYEMLNENVDEFLVTKIMNGILRNVNLSLDIVYSIDLNEYNNNIQIQLLIKDFRISNFIII